VRGLEVEDVGRHEWRTGSVEVQKVPANSSWKNVVDLPGVKGLHPAGLVAPDHDGDADDLNQFLRCHGTSSLLNDGWVEVLWHVLVPIEGNETAHELVGVRKGVFHSSYPGKGRLLVTSYATTKRVPRQGM